jgi:hypothetical protein
LYFAYPLFSGRFGREGDYWENVVRAVARAAQDHPLYLETTYRDARNRVTWNMK